MVEIAGSNIRKPYVAGTFYPEAADAQAMEDQATLIESFGGRDKAMVAGTPGATPVPGYGNE